MKAAVVPHHGTLEVREVCDPMPGPYDCLVDIDACATCAGTDTAIIEGYFPFLEETPYVLGHESTGRIVEVGEKVESFQLGQRVTRPAGILPGERRDGIGSNWGGFAELGLVRDVAAAEADGIECRPMHAQSRRPLPDDVDPISGALSINHREILSVALKLGLKRSSRVVVIGSGYNGLLFALFAAHLGVRRVVLVGSEGRSDLALEDFKATAFVDYRREDAVERAAEAVGGEPTHLIDAVGTVSSVRMAQQLAGPQTAFGCYGIKEFEEIQPVVDELTESHPELDMGTDEVSATDRWYDLWQEDFFDREGMCDGTMPLSRVEEAYERLARREALKLVICC
jgi:threonine dehydrogenase-like Zn-dependent dehydrogenase